MRKYRKQNQDLKLYKSIFYRKLGEAQKNTHNVDKKNIYAFWQIMLTNRSKIENKYEQYLYEFLPDTDE